MTHPLLQSILVLLLLPGLQAEAQSRKSSYSREIAATVENDILFAEDYYYTGGQDLIYRQLVRPGSRFYKFARPRQAPDSAKVIMTYRGGFKIFTPFDIHFASPQLMDRPYAGWTYVNASLLNYPSHKSGNQYQVELGLTGPASGMEALQKWLHHVTHYDQPQGWEYQLSNELAFNASYQRLQQIRIFKEMDIISQSGLQVGTTGNRASQELTLRLGDMNSLDNSAFTNSRLSWDTPSQGRARPIEFFFFGGIGIHYVLSDMFIQGSLVTGTKSPVEAQVQSWVNQHHYGLMLSTQAISWGLKMYHFSKDMVKGTSHDYFSIFLSVRF